jgi:hypothetical protein
MTKQATIDTVAIHEAGHAVAYVHEGVRFRYVSIKRKGNVVGRVFAGRLHTPLLLEAVRVGGGSIPHYPLLRDFVERKAVAIYAGPFAEKRYNGDSDEWEQGAGDDAQELFNTQELYGFDEDDMGAFAQRAANILNDLWPAVHDVAQNLVDREKLSEKQVRKLVRPHIKRLALDKLNAALKDNADPDTVERLKREAIAAQ